MPTITKRQKLKTKQLENKVELLDFDKKHFHAAYINLYTMLEKLWQVIEENKPDLALGILDQATITDAAMWHLYNEQRARVKRSQRKPRKPATITDGDEGSKQS